MKELTGLEVFKEIINQITDAVLVIDPLTGKYIYCNESASRMLHLEKTEIVEKSPNDISPEFQPDGLESEKKARKLIEETLRIGKNNFDWIHVCGNGDRIEVEVALSRITYDGRVYIVVSWRDITEKRAIEKKYTFLLNELPEMIFLINEKGKILLVNDQGEIQLGYDIGELKGESVLTVFPREVHDIVRKQVEVCLDEPNKIHEWTIQKIKKNGRLIWVKESARVIAYGKGKKNILIVCQDVTEQKKMEDNLAESEARFRSLVEKAPIGIHQIDRNGRTVYLNGRFIDITGYELNDVPTKKSWFELAYRHNHAEREKAMGHWSEDTKKAKPGEFLSKEFNIVAKDGKEVLIQFFIVILEDGGQLLFINDITKQRETEKKLQHSQKMEAIGILAGGIAHDFNNILTAIIGYCSLALTESFDSRVQSFLNEVIKSSNRAADLTKKLLVFSRKKDSEISDFTSDILLKQVESFLKVLVGEHIALLIKAPQKEIEIRGDFSDLYQVLVNLILNSKDAIESCHGPTIGGTIEVEMEEKTLNQEDTSIYSGVKPGKFIHISVSDNGSGIKEADLPKIFNPFFTTKEIGKGTGLGLSIVYGIVSQHKGFVTVESQERKGTTFHVLLPMLQKNFLDKREDENAYHIKGLYGKGERILFVEDNDDLRVLISKILKENGYRVFPACDASEAFHQLKEMKRCDILISDVVLPGGVDGMGIAESVLRKNPEVKCILMSGFPDDRIKPEEIREKGYSFLPKPFDLKIILEEIRRVISKE